MEFLNKNDERHVQQLTVNDMMSITTCDNVTPYWALVLISEVKYKHKNGADKSFKDADPRGEACSHSGSEEMTVSFVLLFAYFGS